MLEELMAKMDAGFARMDLRFEQIDHRFDQIDRRFERVEGEIAGLRVDVTALQTTATEHGQRLTSLETAVHRQGVLLERNTDAIQQLAEKIGSMDASMDQKIDDLTRTFSGRLEPLEGVVREHSRRLDGR